MVTTRFRRSTLLVLLVPVLSVSATPQEPGQPPLQPSVPPAYALVCRGGGPFAFDTLRQMDGVPIIQVAMGFTPAGSAAGSDPSGLPRGRCAWVDRPLNAQEPSVVWFTQPLAGMAGPQDGLRDPDRYWRFMVYNTGQGHLESVAHAAWRTAAVASRPPRRFPTKFAYFAGLMLIASIPASWIRGRFSAWRRLAAVYPAALDQAGRRVRCGFLVIGSGTYKGVVRLSADPAHLHVSMGILLRPGYPTFSVPWADITATRDRWPWSLPPAPVVRLTFARAPDIRFLIRPRVAEAVVAASDGRLRVHEPPGDHGVAVGTGSARG